MVEVLHKSLGLKVKCMYCGSVLKFQWEDMKYLHEDSKRTQYIECPVCHEKIFVRDKNLGWINGTARIYEDANKEDS